MCAIKTDKLIACIVCDCSVCESCISTVSLDIFVRLCCLWNDRQRLHSAWYMRRPRWPNCQNYWKSEVYVLPYLSGIPRGCERRSRWLRSDLHEYSPLARLCIESLAFQNQTKRKIQPKKVENLRDQNFSPKTRTNKAVPQGKYSVITCLLKSRKWKKISANKLRSRSIWKWWT